MDLITLCIAVGLLTMSITGFFYLIKLQDRYIKKIRDKFGNRDDDRTLRV